MPFTAWKHTERDRQRDSTKIQDIQECVSFSPEFYRNRTKIQDFSFLADRMPAEAYCYDRRCFVFFTRILPRWDQNSGLLKKKIEIFFHIRSVILFHRNFTATVPKFRTYRSVFLFHQNFTATVPKFRTFQFYIQEVLLFSPEFYRDRTKIQDMQECVSFSPEFYRNRTKIQDFSISHTGGVSFFTRILPRPYQN